MDQGLVVVLISAAVTLIGVGVAAAVAVYQITKQARMGLKVELYREVLAAIGTQGKAEGELSTKLTTLNSLIALWIRKDSFGGVRPTPSTSWAELHDLNYKAQTEGAELMCLIEKWQIVDPRLNVFRLAFGSALHDMRQAWALLSEELALVVPVLPGAPIPPEPEKEVLEAISAANQTFQDALSKLGAWVADFQLEMQWLLLADLFDNGPSYREPLDPQFFVVRLDRYDTLKEYFLEQTPWGREMRAVNERAKAQIATLGR
jgi:hypothetical protein